MTPADALAAIDALEKFGIDLGLERVVACLRALGDPQLTYPSVHVGGTNGKGSTALLVSRVLARGGRRVGLYTSPPLESFGERIQVDGHPLPDREIPGLLGDVQRIREEVPGAGGMTQFEVITAMAFLHFARAGVDLAVVEVGLGGRLDSTNVVRSEVTVVTNVGLEHAEHLGPTVAAIAREKAGIVKPSVPLVTAAEAQALAVLEEEAAARGAPMYAWGRDFRVDPAGDGRFSFRGRRWTLDGLELGLRGGYQRFNLGTALATLEVLEERGWTVPEGALRAALAEARWPGRCEVLGPGPRVVLDGAHNPPAARALAGVLRSDLPHRRLWLVLGILGDKDARSVLEEVLPLADGVVLTRSRSARARDPGEVQVLARRVSAVPLEVAPTVPEAVDAALARAGRDDLVCVTGSLTTVGEARAHLRAQGWVR